MPRLKLIVMFCLAVVLTRASAWAQPGSDDEFWQQRILSSASLISSQLDYSGRVTAMAIRKNQPALMLVLTKPDLGMLPSPVPTTVRTRAARAQAAGTITAAWMRYCGEVNAACIDMNLPLKIVPGNPRDLYDTVLSYGSP